MRKISALLISAFLFTAVASCSLNSAAAKLLKAVDNTDKQAATLGVYATDTLPDGTSVTEVQFPSNPLFVDSAVFNTDGSLKQTSRKTPGDVLSLRSAFSFARASVNSDVDFASTTFKVESSEISENQGIYTLKLKLKDTTGSMGTVETKIDYVVKDDLVQSVAIQDNLYNKTNPEEVCLYYPTGCSIGITLSYDQETITNEMKQAIALYESTQLHDKLTVANFEEIMTQMTTSYNQLSSWTTTDSTQESGTIFDATSNQGVSWDQFGDPAVAFTAANSQESNNGPDRGFTATIFFDTTDGGSTFFYDKVSSSVSGNTTTYDVSNTDGSIVGSFIFTNGILSSIVDNTIGVKVQYQVNPKADLVLLKQKRS